MAYGLQSNGFIIKPFTAIQADIQASMKAIFGSDLDVSDQSVAGQFINEQANEQSNLWELAQFLYSGFSPDTASGAALDDVCARVNVSRLPATASKVIEILYDTVGTVISAGHLVSQEGTNLQLSLDTGITIQASSSVDTTIGIQNVIDHTLYSLFINGTEYDFTSGGSTTAILIIAGLTAALGTIAGITISNPTTSELRLLASDGETAFNVVIDANSKINTLGSPGNYSAVIPGAVPFPADSVTQIVTAISGLDSVNNLVPAVIGRNLETDDNLRVRRKLALRALGKGTDESIASNLIQNVAGVTSAYVYSNRGDTVDGSGRPAHSFEAVVTGGSDADVANMIWQCMPSGINTYGNDSYVVTDSNGQVHTIYFSRPQNVYVWLKIAISYYSEEIYPADGDAAVATAIVNWSEKEFNAGVDVILQRILSPIYTIPGISEADITIAIKTDMSVPAPGDYTSTEQTPIAANQIAEFDITRIFITP